MLYIKCLAQNLSNIIILLQYAQTQWYIYFLCEKKKKELIQISLDRKIIQTKLIQ